MYKDVQSVCSSILTVTSILKHSQVMIWWTDFTILSTYRGLWSCCPRVAPRKQHLPHLPKAPKWQLFLEGPQHGQLLHQIRLEKRAGFAASFHSNSLVARSRKHVNSNLQRPRERRTHILRWDYDYTSDWFSCHRHHVRPRSAHLGSP